jgi:protease I
MARIAAPLADDFEDVELTEPTARLREAGHEVVIIGSGAGKTVRGKRGKASVEVAMAAKDASSSNFDALLIVGGYSPDRLRMNEHVVRLVREFAQADKPIAAVCHGPQLLIEAGVVRGKTVTSWPSVRTDLINAGAKWVDREVVVEGPLITSRKPEDLKAFSEAFLVQLGGRT